MLTSAKVVLPVLDRTLFLANQKTAFAQPISEGWVKMNPEFGLTGAMARHNAEHHVSDKWLKLVDHRHSFLD